MFEVRSRLSHFAQVQEQDVDGFDEDDESSGGDASDGLQGTTRLNPSKSNTLKDYKFSFMI